MPSLLKIKKLALVNKNIYYGLFILVIVIAIASSCTPLKKQIYLQESTADLDTMDHIRHKHKIQPGDQLYIRILGLDEKTYSFFNPDQGQSTRAIAGGGASSKGNSMYFESYSVSDSGSIIFPFIGELKLKGFTLKQARNKIQEEIGKYIKNATVIVKLSNFSITILGEVNKPGIYPIYNDEVNLVEAIAMAGDITMDGKKTELIVFRRNAAGDKTCTKKIDFTSRGFTESEYFFLKPNDIIYVEPLRTKQYSTNPMPITTMLSLLTTGILLINYVSNLSK